jgi:hypothetical protein
MISPKFYDFFKKREEDQGRLGKWIREERKRGEEWQIHPFYPFYHFNR